MTPYFQLTTLDVGPLTIQTWGLLVAIGILVGAWVASRHAKRRGMDASVVWDAAVWITVASMVGARAFHVLVYEPTAYLADPLSALAFWEGGLSMFGGLLGATAAAYVFLRRRKLDFLPWADTIIFGLPIGIGIGRVGCFLIHDHPGTLTHFFLGVRYPDGSVRHDLGLYESLYGFALAMVFFLLARREAKPPTYLVTFLASYGVFRFATDFLRVIDTRYSGLTPAQYLSIGMIAAALVLFARERKKLSDKN